MPSRARTWAEKLLAEADVKIGGDRPWDITVRDERFFDRVLRHGSLGLGESYMDGWWDAPALDQFFEHVLRHNLQKDTRRALPSIALAAASTFFNNQSSRKAFEVGERHYDVGNDLYERMLDKRMVYTCGYWKNAKTLDEAQEAKLDLVCKKLGLAPGMRVLDVGCGWGSFAKFAAERYDVSVVGITVSKEQRDLAIQLCTDLPVEFRLEDYRATTGTFDRIVSLGMFEHVGYKNYRTYLKKMSELLAPDGLMLLHTIGNNISRVAGDPWSHKYIFPNGMIPSIAQIGKAAERLFVMEDWHNFGADYDTTLMHWFKNFDIAWPSLRLHYGGDRFYRMWKYYLLSFAGSFRARKLQLWQIVFSPRGMPGGYQSVR